MDPSPTTHPFRDPFCRVRSPESTRWDPGLFLQSSGQTGLGERKRVGWLRKAPFRTRRARRCRASRCALLREGGAEGGRFRARGDAGRWRRRTRVLTQEEAQSGAGVCACSFLEVGQAFEGSQHVSHGLGAKDEAWNVKVRVQGCDMERGYVCGVMEALNVPTAESKVMTFWEGEVVDNVNHTFYTSKWGADRESDVKHWSKFPHFAKLRENVHRDGGRDADLSELPCIFMRWKEKFFVNVGPDCGLTIAGFYYICLVRSSGEVKGYYFDPSSSPYQKLELKASYEDCQGKGFPTYEFH